MGRSGWTLIIFDVDGTLIDTAVMVTCGQDDVAEALGFDEVEADLMKEAWRALATVGFGEPSSVFMQALKYELERHFGVTCNAQAEVMVEHFWRGYWKACRAEIALEVLSRALDRGIRVAVSSNGNRDRQLKKLKLAGIYQLFDSQLIQIEPSDGIRAKPSPAMIDLLMRQAKASPNESLMVGDRESDVAAARLAGCRSGMLTRTKQHPNVTSDLLKARDEARRALSITQPDYFLSNLADVLKVIQYPSLPELTSGTLIHNDSVP
ncbi:HAD family hydrolase [Streptomyces sp. bgisy027]|uniref:HAD family hydrolase n=1 Tax=Streptomyces sp. bgisy027 TaxID=3413770 RepID=UPI003D71098C